MDCPACHSHVVEGSAVCSVCNFALTVRCPSCGADNSLSSSKCATCRAELNQAQGVNHASHNGLAAVHPISQAGTSAERRQLTVMFCDIAGSSELASTADPEDFREIVRAVLQRVTDVVARFDGFVAEYMGDGVLIYFGYPEAHENDVECAIRAALQATEEVAQLVLLDNYRPQVRIGIATGLVVVGRTGESGVAAIGSATGATPNLAARLQAAAEPGGIVVSNETRALAGRLFEYRGLGKLHLKGFPVDAEAWQVIAPALAESRFEALHEINLGPLIGRESESKLLEELWRKCLRGAGQVVLVSGEAGVGKSRLTAMLMDKLAGERHVTLRYFCSPHLQGSPLHPCIQQLERAAGFARGDSPEKKRERLEATLIESTNRLESAALMAELLSLPPGENYPALPLAPQQRKEKIMNALVRQVDLLSMQDPILMIFEDAQWSDPTTRELFPMVVDLIANRPIFLVVTFRPEFQPGWIARRHVSEIRLQPLNQEQSLELVDSIADSKKLSPAVRGDIVDRSDGVPLYIEELTKAVLETSLEGDLTPRMAAASQSVMVPATLHSSLLTRLDRLGNAKEVAQIGAALGREFTYEHISALAHKSEEELREALVRLTHSGLVFASGNTPDTTYLFKHVLIQEAAYDTMLRANRLELHRRIVDLLEVESPELMDIQPEVLADHSTKGGLVEKALGYWLKAGHRALMKSAMAEAVSRLRNGLNLIKVMRESNDFDQAELDQKELDFHIALGKALIATKGYAAQVTGDVFTRARKLCESLDQAPQLLAVQHGLWTHALLRGDMVTASGHADEVLKKADAMGNPLWALMARRFAGVTSFPMGEFEAGRYHLERGLQLFDPALRSKYSAVTVDDTEVLMKTYLAYLLLYLGDLDQAREAVQEALQQGHELKQPYSIAHALVGNIYLKMYLGYPADALGQLEQLQLITSEFRIDYYAAFGTMLRGACISEMGRAEEAIDLLNQGLAAYRATESGLYMPSFLAWIAKAHGRADRPGYGLKLLEEALEIINATNMRNDEAEIHRLRGELLVAIRDAQGAEKSFQQAMKVAAAQKAKVIALRAASDLAKLQCGEGKATEAHQLLGSALAKVTEGHDLPIFREATTLLNTLG